MKITQTTGISNVLRAYGKNVRKMSGAEKVGADRMEISAAAFEMQVARKALDSVPEIREEKVAEIKKLMASGQYKPSAEEVIEKMLSRIGQ